MMQDVQAERDLIMSRLSYDPETGVFRWKTHRCSNLVGAIAGCRSGAGYVRIYVNDRSYKAHRLAWLIAYGCWPQGDIDHINMDKGDNRICNLRDVNRSENMQNRRVANANNLSCGLLGVTWSKQHNRFAASIHINGKRLHLGLFDDAQAAHAAYVAKKRSIHPAGML